MSTTNFTYRCKNCGTFNAGQFKTLKEKLRVGPPIFTGLVGVESSGIGAATGQAGVQAIGVLLIMVTFALLMYSKSSSELQFTKQVCKKCNTDNTQNLLSHFGGGK